MELLAEIRNLRLWNQRLVGEKLGKPEDVVRWLGAVQAQDWAGVKWSVGVRMEGALDRLVEEAFNEGKFLRVHMMRPTWHLVAPEDLRWIQRLTGPRVLAMNAHMCRKLDLDDQVLRRCHDVLEKALAGKNFLTREEISQALGQHKIEAKGQRLAYIMMEAEASALVCNGPRRGKQFTYGLVDEVVPRANVKEREEALAELAARYARSHGPVQVRDFAWWSGLTKREAEEAFGLAKLAKMEVEGKEYWVVGGDGGLKGHGARSSARSAWLLSIYDEYTIAYNDRSALGDEKVAEKLLSMGNALTAVVVLDGRIVGTWKRKVGRKAVEVSVSLLGKVDTAGRELIDEAVERYRRFVEV